jgi:DNA end-binding protein Ku
MAAPAFWKGYLKLSLVTCPVALMPALSESAKVRFHTLNRDTGNRIESRFIDAVTEKPVDEDDEVKGYQSGEDRFVMLEDKEIDAVALESTHTIDIDLFAPSESIDWIWYDKPHYLVPDDPVGEEAFSVIREAMTATGTVGVARLVLYRRERAVMLVPRDKGIILWTLRYGDEVREAEIYFGDIKVAKPQAKSKSLVMRLIDERSKPWSPAMVADPVQERLLDIIASKKKKKSTSSAGPKPETRPGGKLISIVDALRQSIAAEEKSARK